MGNHLESFGRRAASDQYFLASALNDYVVSEQLDDEGLANLLGCNFENLSRLRLCRRPRPETTTYWSDIERIATHFGVDEAVLAQVVRRSDALQTFRQTSVHERGTLMAARDLSDGISKPEKPSGES